MNVKTNAVDIGIAAVVPISHSITLNHLFFGLPLSLFPSTHMFFVIKPPHFFRFLKYVDMSKPSKPILVHDKMMYFVNVIGANPILHLTYNVNNINIFKRSYKLTKITNIVISTY